MRHEHTTPGAQERMEAAIAAIKACEIEDRAEIVAAVCPTIPDDVWDDRAEARATAQIARDFFDTSSETTVKLYAIAAWERMKPASRAGFVAWLQKQVKAEG